MIYICISIDINIKLEEPQNRFSEGSSKGEIIGHSIGWSLSGKQTVCLMGKSWENGGLMGFNGGLMGFNGGLMGF